MRRLVLLLAFAAAACDPPRDRPKTATNTAAVEPATWPTSVDATALAALDADSRAAVSRSPVPVLVPKKPEWLSVGKVMSEENWYAFSATKDGVTISIHASRIAHRHDDIPPAKGKQVVRGIPAFVSKNESIWSASWRELGVAYALDVECHEPSDGRCATDAMMQEIASSLVYVGGNGGAQ